MFSFLQLKVKSCCKCRQKINLKQQLTNMYVQQTVHLKIDKDINVKKIKEYKIATQIIYFFNYKQYILCISLFVLK